MNLTGFRCLIRRGDRRFPFGRARIGLARSALCCYERPPRRFVRRQEPQGLRKSLGTDLAPS
ncbi:MAG TPA: hypothetical protein DCQ98_16265 [Planctomycetaceae bacterium]|nr:hypothetical protein [Planctomycetaceae bacterium]